MAERRAHPGVHRRHLDQPRAASVAGSCCCTVRRSSGCSARRKESGSTLVPLALYFKDGKAKVEIALARGKKLYDKRQALAEKQAAREMSREIGRRAKGRDY